MVWTIIATIEDPNAKPENATEASNVSHVLIDDTKVNCYNKLPEFLKTVIAAKLLCNQA